jgi:hypothetical protein
MQWSRHAGNAAKVNVVGRVGKHIGVCYLREPFHLVEL